MATLPDVRPWMAARENQATAAQRAESMQDIETAAISSPVFGMIEDRFRQIAARCLDYTGPTRSQSVAISSATVGEGKSSVAIGIAVAAGQNLGSDVLILEADMQRPQLASDFGLDSGPGLSEYLSSDIGLESIIQATRIPNVWLLPAGMATPTPGPLIRSKKFDALMKTLHSVYQTIIIDAPPLLTSPDAAAIANQAESLVLVARAGHTHMQDAAKALKAANEVPIRGIVLNGTRVWLPGWLCRLLGVSRFSIE